MCSAIWVHDKTKEPVHKPRNTEYGIVVTGYRHCDCFETLVLIYPNREYLKIGYDDGFLTTEKRFVGREEAKVIAREAGQLLKRASKGTEMYSEDVW